MYLKIKNKKIEVVALNSFSERFKSIRFKLEKIDYALCYPKRKIINTYLFCQKVDVIFCDKNYVVLGVLNNVRSEKFVVGPKDTYYIFVLGDNTVSGLEEGDKLKLKKI